MKINATTRLLAVMADSDKALKFLKQLGFEGLKLKSDEDNMIKFFYRTYDLRFLYRKLGQPKDAEKSIRFDYGDQGVIAIWEKTKTVVLKNKDYRKPVELPPQKLPDTRPAGPDVPEVRPTTEHDPRTGTQNDDSSVPHLHLEDRARQGYLAAQRDNKEGRIQYMRYLHALLNRLKFGSGLKRPNFRFLKDTGTKFRKRAHWFEAKKELAVSPRLFNASYDFFIEVFLHEMCHQATWEISNLTVEQRAEERKTKGHGPVWQEWMRKVGLNPLRFDPLENSEYMTREEKQQHDERRAKGNLVQEEIKRLGLRHERDLVPGRHVNVAFSDGLRQYLIACKTKKTVAEYAIVDIDFINNYTPGSTTVSWFKVNAAHIYNAPDPKPIDDTIRAQLIVKSVQRFYERQAEQRNKVGF